MCWLRVCAWLRVKIKVKGTGVPSVLPWRLYHRMRQFLICWLCVKIKAKGTGVHSVLSWRLYHRTRQFHMCWNVRNVSKSCCCMP